ncbi:hypothetical protein DFH29DRAFT_1079976 [Suillus ampliporus]|nr:hypothetical protein DFH29DRAFT_1079976 [Suillus ampliporus]
MVPGAALSYSPAASSLGVGAADEYNPLQDASDHRRLDELPELDKPGAHLLPAAPIIEEEGLVVTEFSDEEVNDETYEW